MPIFPKLAQVGRVLQRLTWEPESGAGSRGGLRVSLASNFKSVSVDFGRTCQYMSEIPKDVFQPATNTALKLAEKYSSGAGKPPGYYSLRHSRMAMDYQINIKSGKMVKSWRKRPVEQKADTVRMGIYNTARSRRGFNYPLALFTGTVKMRDRALPQKVQEDIKPELDRLMKVHRMRVLRAWGKGR